METNEELTLEEKLEKALWAANVFSKYSHKGQAVWAVEHILIRRIVAGSDDSKTVFAKLEEYQTGVQESIVVKVPLMNNLRYDWWEAEAIATALEKQKYLPNRPS
ncbi:hypothetical protein [Nostoc sp.]|uniref:hypothetical protein n=1 Tax=Nostoc sp. TaxID=1180 RepID=UPI002FF0F989